MPAHALRLICLGMLCFAPAGMPVAAAPVDPADQARIEQDAVKAYVGKTDSDRKAASDKLVAQNSAALWNDPGSAVLGNPNGDVTIVEFFDYNCSYSQRVEPRLEALLKSDPGVRLILKEFAIEPAVSSPPAARAALASIRQGKYEAYHQAMLTIPGHKMTVPEVFDDAQKVGLDVARLRNDMEAAEIYNQIIANFNLARAVRVFQTPTFIIGGHIITEPSAQIDFPRLVAAARGK
jgi:protein-disulfide isomerase